MRPEQWRCGRVFALLPRMDRGSIPWRQGVAQKIKTNNQAKTTQLQRYAILSFILFVLKKKNDSDMKFWV